MTTKHLRQALLVIIMMLLGIGIVAVYSASALVSEANYGGSIRFLTQHLFAIACGLVLGSGCLMLPYDAIRRAGRWLLPLCVLLLVLVALFGQEVGGARRWLRFGRWGIQPSEFAQLALVLYLADVLARHAGRLQDFWRGLLPPLAVTGLTSVLVLAQPDLGTTIAMGAVALLLLVVAKARWPHLLGITGVSAVALVLLIAGAEYRRRRILAFLDPWADPRGSGYQILQSFFAMASGGVSGLGVGASLQKLFFLPSAHTDFIFAIIGEELGLIGTTAVIALFGLFMLCGFRLAMLAQDLLSKYLLCGLVGMIGLEAMVNMAVVVGLLPTKGLPLPLISYGGSAMVMNLMACALIFHASRHGERFPLPRAADH
jgi:cell division protein FtsW